MDELDAMYRQQEIEFERKYNESVHAILDRTMEILYQIRDPTLASLCFQWLQDDPYHPQELRGTLQYSDNPIHLGGLTIRDALDRKMDHLV